MSPKVGKALFFSAGVAIGGYAHAKMMFNATLAASYLPLTYLPKHLAVVFLAMLACSMIGSVLLVVTGWWRSVYREQWQPLFTVMLTSVCALAVLQAVANGHFEVAWFALVLIVAVLYAGVESARALWRELKPRPAKLEGRAF